MALTTLIGKKHLRIVLAIALSLIGTTLQAATVLTLDRQQIHIDDTFRMTIRVTDGENLESVDLAPLNSNFDILGRSQNSRHIFGSAGNESWSELTLTLAPKHTGTLYIPALDLDGVKTEPTQIIVREAAPLPGGTLDTVFVEIETDKETVFVQEQFIFTVRIFQSINLDNASISELKLENSFIEQISQTSSQRSLNGTTYLVREIKYAIFPQKSGQLELPALSFSGVQLNRRRSLFDMGGQGKTIRRQTDRKTVTIKSIPAGVDNENWLPADQLTIDESWSVDPDQLSAGESATRTITIKGEGLLSTQLPPTLPPTIDGIKFYPDQPKLESQQSELGVNSQRIDSSAMVITRAGQYSIPETKISWWDVKSNKRRWAIIASREFSVSPLSESQLSHSVPIAITPAISAFQTSATPASTEITQSLIGNRKIWQWLTAFTTLGWLATVLFFYRSRQRVGATANASPMLVDLREKELYKAVLKSLKSDNLTAQRQAIIHWAQSYWQNPGLSSLADLAKVLQDQSLCKLVTDLDSALYGSARDDWDSLEFSRLLTLYRKTTDTPNSKKRATLPPLYDN